VTLKKKKVLVTGAGGFIGSHLVERLVAIGAEVTALIRYNSAGSFGNLDLLPAEVLREIRIVPGDLRDYPSVADAMRESEIVLHLGALIAIPYSYVNPRGVLETNAMGTFNVLQAAREQGVRRVVNTSTSEVYGTAREVPISEAHPLQGQSPYSASKIAADKIAEAFYCSYELPVVTLRPFNTYGPRQSARAVIPTIISQAMVSKTVKLGSLHPTRDLTYVTDTVEGFILAATAPGIDGETIQLGTGDEVSVGDLVKRIGRLMGTEIAVRSQQARRRPAKSEVERLVSTPAKARRALKWKPKVRLDEGLRRTIDWVQANPDLFKPSIYSI
jgi:NAD dependent epimerase/dehydratase